VEDDARAHVRWEDCREDGDPIVGYRPDGDSEPEDEQIHRMEDFQQYLFWHKLLSALPLR
jgi:hypothetical protein